MSRVALTLPADLHAELERRAKIAKRPLATYAVELLREAVTPLRAEQREVLIGKAVDRVFYLLKNHDRTMRAELHALQQMVGLFVQAFYNHTPEIDDEHEEAAYASGAARFERFFQTLEETLKQGQSVFHMEVAPDPIEITGEDFSQDAPERANAAAE